MEAVNHIVHATATGDTVNIQALLKHGERTSESRESNIDDIKQY